MRFSDTVGQESVIYKLVSSVNNGRISHAQLFYSKAGAGALSLALAYIQYIACENRGEHDSCFLNIDYPGVTEYKSGDTFRNPSTQKRMENQIHTTDYKR